jgi:hypothetical protein
MDTPPLDNQTEFVVHPQLLLTKEGEKLAAFVKATFEILPTGKLRLAVEERVRPIRHTDEVWEDPEVDSIKYPCDISPEKLGTDIIATATAHAPGGAPVNQFDTYLRVGAFHKAVRIFGLRVWQARGAGLSSAQPLSSLDVRYDFAWGGRDDSDPSRTVEEPRNPVGRGIRAQRDDLTHQLAPQIGDPEQPLRDVSTRPPPAGLGAMGRSFAPRRDLAGTFDESWQEYRCPLPPEDQKDEFHQCASPGLVARPHLQGGEECALLNLHPGGPLQFTLPHIRLQIEFRREGRDAHPIKRPTLNTVLIDTHCCLSGELPVLEMLWVATTPAPRKMASSLIVVREDNNVE